MDRELTADSLSATRLLTSRSAWALIAVLSIAALTAIFSATAPAATTPGTGTTTPPVKPAAEPSTHPLEPFFSDSGLISQSVDAIGTNDPAGGPVLVHKNSASATVRKAYLFVASTGETDYTPVDGDVTIDGKSVTFEPSETIASDIDSVNTVADVTSLIKEKVDSAPTGNVSFTVAEPNNTELIDGEILAVTLNDPTASHPVSVTFLYGAQNPTGDTFHVGLAEPVDKSNPAFALNLSLGISFGFQPAGQYSEVEVNNKLLTSSAGGQDDACPVKYAGDEEPECAHEGIANGELITVGGIGDTNENPPDPSATDETCMNAAGEPAPRCDDELYSLLPFVNNGETELSFHTLNPSDNDNIFFAALETQANAAVVGEGITLAPLSATNKVGETHTLTATVQNEHGERLSGKAVTFEVISGPNAGTKGEETTNTKGEATFSYSSKVAGVDHIVASFVNAQGEKETSNEVTKTWEEGVGPPPEECTASGKGRFRVKNETQTLVDKLSTDLTAPQKLRFNWNKEGKHHLTLTQLTSAYCTRNKHQGNAFHGKGTATVNGEGGYEIAFTIIVTRHDRLIFKLTVSKGHKTMRFRDAAMTSEVISTS